MLINESIWILEKSNFTVYILPTNVEKLFSPHLWWENKSVIQVHCNIIALLSHGKANRGNVVSYPRAQANLKHISALVVLGPKLRKCSCSAWDAGQIKYPGTNRIRKHPSTSKIQFILSSCGTDNAFCILKYPQPWITVI